jgi:integrase-like protein
MEFAPRFLEKHAVANRQKPSEITAKESILRVHLIPFLGRKRLEAISSENVQELKRRLADRFAKTVNNILTVLSVLLKKAVEWGEIERVPCVIRHLPNPKPSPKFHDFAEYDRLRASARELGWCALWQRWSTSPLSGSSAVTRIRPPSTSFCHRISRKSASWRPIPSLTRASARPG